MSIQVQTLFVGNFLAQYLSAGLSPDGRKGSFIGVRRLANEQLPAPGADPPPTNEAVAQAVQEKVAVSMLLFCINATQQICHLRQKAGCVARCDFADAAHRNTQLLRYAPVSCKSKTLCHFQYRRNSLSSLRL